MLCSRCLRLTPNNSTYLHIDGEPSLCILHALPGYIQDSRILLGIWFGHLTPQLLPHHKSHILVWRKPTGISILVVISQYLQASLLEQLSELGYPSGECQQQYLIYLRYVVLLLVKPRVVGRKRTGVLTRTSELAGRQLIMGFIEAVS